MLSDQYILALDDEIIVDNFAGGGGTSTGIEWAIGRHVDFAINHDQKALAMHMANHPQTEHLCESVWDVDPRTIAPHKKVGLVWLSPDCKHFSKAKGGKPREKKIRGLAWVALRWAALRKPRLIILENVEEFVTWGPLDEQGKPCKKNKGREFNCFVNALKRQGYVVEYKELRACDYGAPTIRKRFFLIARCDGQPIVWPEPTHFDPAIEKKRKKQRGEKNRPFWRTAAECLDFTIPCHSIFLNKDQAKNYGVIRPLADATMRRVAKGIFKYVIDNPTPFIVTMAHGEGAGKTKRWGDGARDICKPMPTITASGGYGLATPFITEHANASSQRNMSAESPLRTQCAQVKGGHFALVAPLISTYYGEKSSGDARGHVVDEPLRTQTTENRHAVVSAFLAKHYTGVIGTQADKPISTITSVDHHSLVTSNMVKMRGDNIGTGADEPLHTISAGGQHHAEVRAFLIKYYGNDGDNNISDPLHTITSKDRFGLVQVKNDFYQIIDIGLRMLTPRELFLCQGFNPDYIIDRGMIIDHENGQANWIKLTKTEQVRMVGNSVPPQLSCALVKANYGNKRSLSAAA